jgi:hypothetical protein
MSDWTTKNDTQSVHVGINHRLWLCRQNNEIPVRILLGKEHTRLFMREKGWSFIPRGPHVYGTRKVPLVFNAKGIHGIAVETTPKIPAKTGRKRARSSDEKDHPT